jgi:hypothetical protein
MIKGANLCPMSISARMIPPFPRHRRDDDEPQVSRSDLPYTADERHVNKAAAALCSQSDAPAVICRDCRLKVPLKLHQIHVGRCVSLTSSVWGRRTPTSA